MKKIAFFSAIVLLLAATSCKDRNSIVVNADATPQLNNINDSLSWALGFSMAQNLAATGVEINREVLFQSICATLDSKQQPMTQRTTTELLMDLEQRAAMNRMQNSEAQMKEVRAREEVYFSKLMQDNPNVKKSDMGFYYEILKQGNGKIGQIGNIVVFDYKGLLTNGQIFDQTYGNRDAITHVIDDGMMPGLTEAFCMMPAGSTYRFYFPCEMGFGAKGTADIPPYATLIYEIELHEVK
ncbi:MAG: FKBP-type peptidyl-prolyl cis-trans isomerase [Bacteroidales bacterium]|nr:FKBP-type peptidyl-prolyl cis-trans isomerase [Bacteroidales bacterium]